MFELLFDILFTIIFLVPFGISMFYFVMAFRLLLTAVTEHSEVKRKGSVLTLALAGTGMLASFLLWRYFTG